MESPGLFGGRYELRDVLGFGGMAEVRDAWDTRLNRAVAVKLLYPGLSAQADIRERFKIEACAAAGLNHPNIVGVYDFGDHEGTPFIVMERLPGNTLGDQIALGPLPQEQVYTALGSVLSALSLAHEAGMLHRDIKPGNILPTPTGTMKVADFGIVKAPGSVHTTTGQIIGTLAYLSPDRIAGKPASVADDLYAAGVVGYEALTGRKPYTQEDIAPLAHAIVEGQPPPVSVLRPDADPRLVEVIETAMSRDPSRRFDSADAMWAALNGGDVGPSGPVPTPVAQVRPPTRVLDAQQFPPSATYVIPPPRRRRLSTRTRKVAGAAAVLVALSVTALAFAMDPSSTTQPTESVGTSTPVVAPPVIPAAVPPSSAPPPAPAPVVEQAPPPPQQRANNGNGNGNKGNGNGNKKPKD
ncbi:MAG: serine/threonine-protein kinase [Mycobacterium sp.]